MLGSATVGATITDSASVLGLVDANLHPIMRVLGQLVHNKPSRLRRMNAAHNVWTSPRTVELHHARPASQATLKTTASIPVATCVGSVENQFWRSGCSVPHQNLVQLPLLTVSSRPLSPDVASVSVPCSVTGHQRATSAGLVRNNPSSVNSSLTTSTVPRDGCTRNHHRLALEHTQIPNPGSLLSDSVKVVGGTWHNLSPPTPCTRPWRPSICRVEMGNTGLAGRKMVSKV